jgi:hypothetical protein
MLTPISSNTFRDSYRFPVAEIPGAGNGLAYLDLDQDGNFDPTVDRQLTGATENSNSAISLKTLQQALAQKSEVSSVAPHDSPLRLSLTDQLPGVGYPITSVKVSQGESGLQAEVTVQKSSRQLVENGAYVLDHDGDGKGDSSLQMSFWLSDGQSVGAASDHLLSNIGYHRALDGQSGPWAESGPGPDRPRIFESPSPFPMAGLADVTRTFTWLEGPTHRGTLTPIISYGLTKPPAEAQL